MQQKWMKPRSLAVPISVACVVLAPALAAADEPPVEESASLHFQSTVATQAHPAFAARYSGQNSMSPRAEAATSVVTDLFGGARLWKGGEFYFQPELAGGRGLSSTLGVAAFPSGEVYRVGDPAPVAVVARAFFRQVIGLGGPHQRVEPGQNQLGDTRDRDRLTLAVGKMATTDFVDNDPLANDPHTQFSSWGIWASAAYDYPADTRGYTWGLAGDLSMHWWSVRAGIFLEPQVSNGMAMEWRIDKARGLAAEYEGRYALGDHAGAARVLAFLNDAHMGSYQEALSTSSFGMDVTKTRAFGRTKYGFAASVNQDLGGGLGAFARASWDDGANETWAFTEIDRSLAAGVVQSGSRWGRSQDEAGAAAVASGLSAVHREYLAAGGYGFLIGDGALNYGLEILGEVYYRTALTREISLVLHYQPVLNPAFNRDRGPIQIFTVLVHVEL